MLGVLRTQIQDIHVWVPQQGMIATHGTTGTSSTEQLLQAKMANTIVLPKGAPTADNIEYKATISRLKGLRLNLAVLPCEVLYQLQD